jgi:hypothetical protein
VEKPESGLFDQFRCTSVKPSSSTDTACRTKRGSCVIEEAGKSSQGLAMLDSEEISESEASPVRAPRRKVRQPLADTTYLNNRAAVEDT